MKRGKRIGKFLRGFLSPAVAAMVLVWFLAAVSGLDEGRIQAGGRQLEEALRRACVACYAAQGAYPPSLDYVEEHYGVQIDRERYAVFYDVFAENLMPDITVLELEA